MTPIDLTLGHTPDLIDLCRDKGLTEAQTAYVLATAYHETAHTMRPVRETLANTAHAAVARLERAWTSGRLSWVSRPYWRPDAEGKSWHGRGYVQITWRRNYERLGARLGRDFTTDPEVVMQPDIAAEILVVGMAEGLFTGLSLVDFTAADGSVDFYGARRVVNGTDRAHEIARIARAYRAALAPDPAPSGLGGLLARLVAMFKRGKTDG